MKSTSAKSSIQAADHASLVHLRKGEIIGFTESEGRGRTANGDVGINGNISFGIQGNPSQGEDGTLKTCSLLVKKLNKKGENWSEPVLVESKHVDAECSNTLDDKKTLNIQVVRSITDRALWKDLGKNKEVSRNDIPPGQVALLLQNAIELKVGKIEVQARENLILALNALDTPAVCFDNVVNEFQTSYGEWARTIGFKNIWLVGPLENMVLQLS